MACVLQKTRVSGHKDSLRPPAPCSYCVQCVAGLFSLAQCVILSPVFE